MNTMKHKRFSMSFNMTLIFFICIAILIFSYSNGITGNDFWWHVKTGEWIFKNHQVPTTGIYSWSADFMNAKWYSQEWLSQLFFYLLYHVFGQVGIFLFCILISLTIFLILFFTAGKKIDHNMLFSCAYFLLTVKIITLFCYGRPQVFSYLFLTISLMLLYHFIKNPDSKKIFFLPLVALLWANFHGGSSNVVYILPLIVLIGSCVDLNIGCIQFRRLETKHLKRLILVNILSFLALFLNPHGINMVIYPYSNMMDKNMVTFVEEWSAPAPSSIPNVIFYYLPIIAVAVLFILQKNKVNATDFLMMGFFAYLTFRSRRFLIFFIIACTFYIFDYVKKKEYETSNTTSASEKGKKLMIGSIFLIAALILCVSVVQTISTYYTKGELIDKPINTKVIRVIKEDSPKRLLNDYNFGEVLIFEGIPVFVDGRADIYSGRILSDYIRFYGMYNHQDDFASLYTPENYMEEIQNFYQFDAFLVNNNSALHSYICSHSDNYNLIYQDDTLSYYRLK